MTAQLIDALHDEHLWADQYSGTLEDVFDIQAQISRKIVGALKMQLSPHEDRKLAERPLADIRAYECYYRALPDIYSFTEDGLRRAVTLIERALEAVGDSHVLYAALGNIYWQHVNAAITADESYLDKAQDYAGRATALHPDSAAGHAVMGLGHYHRGDRAGAVRNLKRALAIEPNNWLAMAELNRIYLFAGAPSSFQRVLDIDPLSLVCHGARFLEEMYAGHPERYEEPMRRLLRSHPEFSMMRLWYALSLINRQRSEDARVLLDEAPDEKLPSPGGRLCGFLSHALAGRRREALAAMEPVLTSARRVEHWSAHVAECYALVDEFDHAIEWLENAIARGFTHYPWLSQHAVTLAKLRVHPRYEPVMQKAKHAWEHFEA